MKTRNSLMVGLGLLSLGISAQSAMAQPKTCDYAYGSCMDTSTAVQKAGGNSRVVAGRCMAKFAQCIHDGSWGNASPPGTYTSPSSDGGKSTGSPAKSPTKSGNTTVVLRYAEGTNPNGTPNFGPTPVKGLAANDQYSTGKEPWWNGKFTTVTLYDGSTVLVKQGAPGGAFIRYKNGDEVPLEMVVNGVRYNVSSFEYVRAVQVWEATKKAVQQARETGKPVVINPMPKPVAPPDAVVRDHRHPEGTPAPTASSGTPAGKPGATNSGVPSASKPIVSSGGGTSANGKNKQQMN